MNDPAVALLSGGLDSGVAVALHRDGGGTIVQCLTCVYGQRAAGREVEAAARLARRFGVPWRRVDLPWLAEIATAAGCALVAPDTELPQGSPAVPGDDRSAAAVWVPARNAVFVTVAAAFAEALGASHVVAGFNREEAATFPDNSAGFVRAASEFLALGTRTAVRVVSPTLTLDKAAIIAAARRLGFSAGDFWSCYDGGERPCGRCESCLRSRW